MGWQVTCSDAPNCQGSWATNIVDLIENHRDARGWFTCKCGAHGYVEKSFTLQEPGEVWEPYLRGIILLGESREIYQPFVFLVSYAPEDEVTDFWFSYYKDLRRSGGRLKLGYGPGGPPVLGREQFLALLTELVEIKCINKEDVLCTLDDGSC